MNEHQRKWLQELRSGLYRQYTGGAMCWRSDEAQIAYCCLGVAHEAVFDGRFEAQCGELGTTTIDGEEGILLEDGDVSSEHLPEWEADALELHCHEVEALTRANDGGLSFEGIADVLEAHWTLGDSELSLEGRLDDALEARSS